MTVGQLITELQKFSPDLPATIWIEYEYLRAEITRLKFSPATESLHYTTGEVRIEGGM